MDGGSQPGNQRAGRQVRGRTLHDVLHDPGTGIAQQAVLPLDPSRVALIARAILTALAAGTVHGYITPHTILLTDDGNALLVGDRVAPGATPANDLFALGMALFEAVEGYAPHPAETLPAMAKAGALAPLIQALTRREPDARPDAAGALALLRASLAVRPSPSPDVTETASLPQVPGAGAPAGDGGASAETSVLPQVPAGLGGPAGSRLPMGPPGPAGPAGPPYYDDLGYPEPEYDSHPRPRRKAMVVGGAFAAVVIAAGVAIIVTRPWHQADDSSSMVPGVSTGTVFTPTAPAAATPSTSSSPAPSATTSTPTPTPTPAVSNPTTLVSMTLCLNAAADAGGVTSGAKVSAETCQGGPNQAWQLHTDGTIHSMADANLCLDAAAPDGKVQNAAQVSAWTCHGGPNQDWAWNANGTVSPVANTALCLDASGPVPIHAGANVTAWPCNGGPNEIWAKE